MNRWLNRSHPSNLQNATVLLYINAAFAFINGLTAGGVTRLGMITILGALAGYGIAGDKKWAYYLGCAAAIAPLALDVLFLIDGYNVFVYGNILSLIFQIVLLVLLFAKDTREYVRIWFK